MKIQRRSQEVLWAQAPAQLDPNTPHLRSKPNIFSGARNALVGEPLAKGDPLAGLLQSEVNKLLGKVVLLTNPIRKRKMAGLAQRQYVATKTL